MVVATALKRRRFCVRTLTTETRTSKCSSLSRRLRRRCSVVLLPVSATQLIHCSMAADSMRRQCLAPPAPHLYLARIESTCRLLHPFNGLFSRRTWVSWYQKGKNNLDLNEARDDGVLGCSGFSWTICKQSARCCRQITTNQHLITQ